MGAPRRPLSRPLMIRINSSFLRKAGWTPLSPWRRMPERMCLPGYLQQACPRIFYTWAPKRAPELWNRQTFALEKRRQTRADGTKQRFGVCCCIITTRVLFVCLFFTVHNQFFPVALSFWKQRLWKLLSFNVINATRFRPAFCWYLRYLPSTR